MKPQDLSRSRHCHVVLSTNEFLSFFTTVCMTTCVSIIELQTHTLSFKIQEDTKIQPLHYNGLTYGQSHDSIDPSGRP